MKAIVSYNSSWATIAPIKTYNFETTFERGQRRWRQESSRLLHDRMAATGKERSPTENRRLVKKTRAQVDAKRRRRRASRSVTRWISLARYGGAKPRRHRKTCTASLYSNSCSTFSQWRCWISDGITRSYFRNDNTRRAAAFNTDCSRRMRIAGRPANVVFP